MARRYYAGDKSDGDGAISHQRNIESFSESRNVYDVATSSDTAVPIKPNLYCKIELSEERSRTENME